MICLCCGETGDGWHFLERVSLSTGDFEGRCPECGAGTEAIVIWKEWEDLPE